MLTLGPATEGSKGTLAVYGDITKAIEAPLAAPNASGGIRDSTGKVRTGFEASSSSLFSAGYFYGWTMI